MFERQFKEGDRVGKLPEKGEFIGLDANNYSFDFWSFEGVRVHSTDIIGEDKFPNTKESGVITIVIRCSSLWTPFY